MTSKRKSSGQTRIIKLDNLPSLASTEPACLVVIYGGQLGQRHVLRSPVVEIGRDRDLDITLPEDAVSRKHARLQAAEGGYAVVDLESTNGTYVNDQPVQKEQFLRHGDLIKIGGTILKYITSGNVESAYYEEIYRMTIIDGLTEIHNRRYLLETMERELARARRHERPLSLIMFDIDHFKRVNDNYGHLTGDYVLRELAHAITRRVRREEVFARYGGEEFALLLPETDKSSAMIYAEQIRALVETHPFTFEKRSLRVTISLGVAQLDSAMQAPAQLVNAADLRLYEAKDTGRNRVCG